MKKLSRRQEAEPIIGLTFEDGTTLKVNELTGQIIEGEIPSMEWLGARFVAAKQAAASWYATQAALESVIFRMVREAGIVKVASPNWGSLTPVDSGQTYVPGGEELMTWLRIVEYPVNDHDALMALIAATASLNAERFRLICAELGYPFDSLARFTASKYVAHKAPTPMPPIVTRMAEPETFDDL